VLPFMRGRGSLGMDGDFEAVVATLTRLAPAFAALEVSFRGSRVLEIGPGRTPEVAMAMLLVGARDVTGLDTTPQVPEVWRSAGHWHRLTEALSGDSAGAFRRATGATPSSIRDRLPHLLGPELPLTFEKSAGSHIPLESGSVDLVISKSVLEHVKPSHVSPLVGEMRRVLRRGGGMAHIIDLRDHMWINHDAVTGDWLDALRYGDRVFQAMFSNRSTAINRLRSSEWRTLFLSQGLELKLWREQRYSLPRKFNRDALAPRWRELPDEDLSVGQLTVALQ
jgi:SAM-dependent methyltransferase